MTAATIARPLQAFDADHLQGVAQLLRLFDDARTVPASAVPDTTPLFNRRLTEDELTGYAYALDVMQTWAAQLEAGALHVSDDQPRLYTPRQIMRDRAKFTGDLARAQQLGILATQG